MLAPLLPSLGAAATARAAADPKLVTAAKQFETVLLGQWLQGAESSFATVPGGDSDSDAGNEQMHGFATQQLASSFTEQGGVGISKLVLGALTKASERDKGAANTGAVEPVPTGMQTKALAAYHMEMKP